MFKMRTIKARILEMTKDDQKMCSSRVIWATLQDVKSGEKYRVRWAESPMVIGITGVWRSRAIYSFAKSWEKCEIGDEVWLYHAEDDNSNFFEPIE